MPRLKGNQYKLTTEVIEQLQKLKDEVVTSIDTGSMSVDQKLKLLQLSLHYELPKLSSTETIEKSKRMNQSLFRLLNAKKVKKKQRIGKIILEVLQSIILN